MQQDDILQSPVPTGTTGEALTQKESREIVTPYAFKVCPNLLGVPLATPLRRLLAIAIDAMVVSALAGASLLALIPVLVFLGWRRWQVRATKHLVLLVIAGLFLVPTAQLAPEYITEKEQAETANIDKDSLVQLAGLALAVRQDRCELACMDAAFADTAKALAQNKVPKRIATDALKEIMSATDYDEAAQPLVLAKILADYPEIAEQTAPQAKPVEVEKSWFTPPEGVHSVLEWAKGILSDLGIGVGWMVFYFTLCVSWANGQTIGKLLLGIQVTQLDGEPLSLFNSFSRQGGYGAGIATGLLGFLQIFWDPNRQAIQDKVSSTVVIRLGQEKRPLTH